MGSRQAAGCAQAPDGKCGVRVRTDYRCGRVGASNGIRDKASAATGAVGWT